MVLTLLWPPLGGLICSSVQEVLTMTLLGRDGNSGHNGATTATTDNR